MTKFLSMNPRFDPTCRVVLAALFACAVLTLPACTSIGTGTGTVEPGDAPVSFSWTSKDAGNSGTMSAVVGASGPAGTASSTFSGPFLQVTSSVRTDAFEPMWNGWGRGWNDWGYWGFRGMFPETAFTTHYSGKVVANLKGPGDRLLRCRFHLNTPAAGMNGGGQGECQFNGGRTVDAVFPRS
jgi:hypothetical protein